MINVAKKVLKHTPTLKCRALSLSSLRTLFKTCKMKIFVKLEFKLLLFKTVSPAPVSLVDHADEWDEDMTSRPRRHEKCQNARSGSSNDSLIYAV
jgi:hypothetical protein